MSKTTLTLGMKFETASGKTKTISVQPCRPDLTAEEVEDVMDVMIDSDVLAYDPVGKLGAQIVERTTTTLF
jgi:hypothetical protein